ncbi:MAG: T9SS type A sorting domain-containing protein [bacterium]
MKKTILILGILATTTGFSQTINFQFDSTQTFQNADVGAMAFADVDKDGDKDVLVIGKGGPIKTTLYLNNGSGSFTALANPSLVNVYDGDVKFLDADNDSDLDVFITGSTSTPSNTANLYLNNGSGIYTLSTGSNFELLRSGKNNIGDADGDGDIDIITTGQNPSGNPVTKLYLNNGSGIYNPQSSSPFTNLQYGAARFIDIDKDGDLDILLCGENNSGQPKTELYNNNGSGIFTINTSSTIDGFTSSDIATGDIDKDGDIDFIICGQSGANIATKLYLNNGSGVFSELIGTPFAPVMLGTVKLADFDNDSDLDVYVMGTGPGGGSAVIAKIYANMGTNTFIEAASIIGAYFSSAAIADVNGDNKLDIIHSGTSFTQPTRATRLFLNTSAILGVNQYEQTNPPIIFPNPTNGKLTLKFNNEVDATVLIYDVRGSLVQSEIITGQSVQIELLHEAGLYLLKIIKANAVMTYRIVLNQ